MQNTGFDHHYGNTAYRPSASGLRILLAEKQALFRDVMRCLLQQIDAELDILEACDFSGVVITAECYPRMDMVLMGSNLPGSKAADPVGDFRRLYPNIPLVVISESECEKEMQKVLRAGARGFISKTASGENALSALRVILAGETCFPPCQFVDTPEESEVIDRRKRRVGQHALTSRQMEVLLCLCEGLSNKEISKKLGLSLGTTKIHIAAIYKVLNVGRRLEVINAAQRLDLLS